MIIKDINKCVYILFSREFMLIVALMPFSYSLTNTNTRSTSCLFPSYSVWWISGPWRNVSLSWRHPASHQEWKKTSRSRWGTLWQTVLKSFIQNFFLFVFMTYHKKPWVGTVQCFSAALGCLRAPADSGVGGILNKLLLKAHHCFCSLGNELLK